MRRNYFVKFSIYIGYQNTACKFQLRRYEKKMFNDSAEELANKIYEEQKKKNEEAINEAKKDMSGN
ncbi:hypothetical protein GCM10008986_25020 [Salinibacillus aidingensis]|uniref:Uncharacterized protein n=1 Tax=Salinibacillus aidingensis TaxID=237684 RepID=A0ABP3LB38_9BACI